MKNFKVIAVATALVLSLAATVFAVSRFATKTVAQTAAGAVCCDDASCCTGGACKMNGSCCSANHEACPLKKQASAEKISFANVPVEDAISQSCHGNNGQTAAFKNCGAGNGSACCQGGGGSCCQSKTKSTASL